MTQTPDSNRLDRIERILDNLVADREQLSGSINLLSSHLDRLTLNVNQVSTRVEQLAISQQTTQTAIDQLASLMVRFAENAEADRTAIRQMQAEIKQIWQYLLSQRPNGSSGL